MARSALWRLFPAGNASLQCLTSQLQTTLINKLTNKLTSWLAHLVDAGKGHVEDGGELDEASPQEDRVGGLRPHLFGSGVGYG